MSSGPIIAAILGKDNAVADFREINRRYQSCPVEEGTIRKLFAASVGENAVHGSDSDENAAIEGDFFFSKLSGFNRIIPQRVCLRRPVFVYIYMQRMQCIGFIQINKCIIPQWQNGRYIISVLFSLWII